MTETRQQDDATQVVRRLDRFVREVIRPARIRARSPLAVAARTLGGEPVSFPEATAGEFSSLAPGEKWGRAWDTVWMHVTGEVPVDWDDEVTDGASMELEVDLGFTSAQPGFQAEGLLHRADGTVVRALSPRSHRVPVELAAGDAVDYWAEAAANPTLHSPGADHVSLAHLGSWDTAGDDLIYRFGGAALVLRDETVTALLHDIEVLRGIAVDGSVSRRRRELILAGLERMLETVDPVAVARTAAAGRKALEPALAAPATSSAMTITAVGHAHIDSAWLWPLRETIRKCARTFSNVVALMEQNPDFVFACSSAQQFQWMRDHYPDLFERIRQRVAAGQFVPVGGMWVESDTNMPSGEALARQFIAGQRFFESEFGIVCEEVWLPDSFGYSGALPQIARLGGTRWFFGQKMSWNRINRMPHHTFHWEGIDGTRILIHFTPADTYNAELTPHELSYSEQNFADHARFSGAIVPFGYGDGGGGPTREMLEAGRRAADAEGVPRVRFGAPRDYFEVAETEATDPAVWSGEMYLELHRGTYTSQARTKRGNRRAEALLRQAELWAATAAVRAGHPYPGERLRRIWERTLLLQFHDILPGSSISWVHQDAERMHEADAVELREILSGSLAALAGDGTTKLEANGSPFRRGGLAPLAIGPEASEPDVPGGTAERIGGDVILRNGLVELRIDGNGAFTDLIDLASGRSLFSADQPGNVFHLHQDIPTDWDAWDIDEHYRRLRVDMPAAESVDVRQGGEPAVLVERAFGASRIRQQIRLIPGEAAVDVTTTVDWHERQRLLKLSFPFRIDARRSRAETQFGHIERPTHENTSWDEARFEVVAHRWMHVGDGVIGAAVVNDSTYGHDVVRLPDPARSGYVTRIRQSLLRGPLYPDPESDQGEHTFRTRLVVDPSVDAATRAAFELDTPPIRVEGSGKEVAPIAEVEGEGVVLQTVKLAEDGSGDIIVRLYESLGRPARARVRIDAATSIRVVDLLERPLGGPPADGAVDLDLRGFEVVTLRAKR